MGKSKEAPYKYEPGTNAHLDAIIGDDEVWIVNRDKGRKPIVATNAQEALDKYERLYGRKKIDAA